MQSSVEVSEADISENLVTRILSGDVCAETEMVERYQHKLYSTIYTQSWDKTMTEDVVQDTWLITLEKVRNSKLRNKKRLGSFISRIGCYQLIMRYRERGRHELFSDELVSTIADEASCPEDALSSSQFSETIINLLCDMKVARDREVLARFYLMGDAKQELCQEYGLKPEHFDRVVYRARERFKNLWSERGRRTPKF